MKRAAREKGSQVFKNVTLWALVDLSLLSLLVIICCHLASCSPSFYLNRSLFLFTSTTRSVSPSPSPTIPSPSLTLSRSLQTSLLEVRQNQRLPRKGLHQDGDTSKQALAPSPNCWRACMTSALLNQGCTTGTYPDDNDTIIMCLQNQVCYGRRRSSNKVGCENLWGSAQVWSRSNVCPLSVSLICGLVRWQD